MAQQEPMRQQYNSKSTPSATTAIAAATAATSAAAAAASDVAKLDKMTARLQALAAADEPGVAVNRCAYSKCRGPLTKTMIKSLRFPQCCRVDHYVLCMAELNHLDKLQVCVNGCGKVLFRVQKQCRRGVNCSQMKRDSRSDNPTFVTDFPQLYQVATWKHMFPVGYASREHEGIGVGERCTCCLGPLRTLPSGVYRRRPYACSARCYLALMVLWNRLDEVKVCEHGCYEILWEWNGLSTCNGFFRTGKCDLEYRARLQERTFADQFECFATKYPHLFNNGKVTKTDWVDEVRKLTWEGAVPAFSIRRHNRKAAALGEESDAAVVDDDSDEMESSDKVESSDEAESSDESESSDNDEGWEGDGDSTEEEVSEEAEELG